MPAASSRSAIVGTVCGIFKMCVVRWGGYGGSRLLTTQPSGVTSPSFSTRPSGPTPAARSPSGASGYRATAAEIR